MIQCSKPLWAYVVGTNGKDDDEDWSEFWPVYAFDDDGYPLVLNQNTTSRGSLGDAPSMVRAANKKAGYEMLTFIHYSEEEKES